MPFRTGIYQQSYKHDYLGTGWTSSLLAKVGTDGIAAVRKPAVEALKASLRFDPPTPMAHIADLAKPFLSLGNQYGEGWFLCGEMAELLTEGVPNIVCIQPFACLPNHVTGRGMFGKIRRLHPEANIVSIDYDPGASEANQLNRIKLMIAAAKKAHNAKFAEAGEPQGFASAD